MDSNPSESEMMADLAAADSAGDTQLAKHIAGRIKTLRAAPTQRQPGQLEAGIEGGLQGASLGWGDEMRGAGVAAIKKMLPNSLGGSSRPMSEEYTAERDRARAENAAGEKAFPKTYAASDLAGSAVTGALATLATGGAAALPMAMGQGAVAGAGYSNANTAGSLARDAGVGAGIGALGYGAGRVLEKTLSGVGRFAAARLRAAQGRAASIAADEVAGGIRSGAASLGGEVQKGSRQVENLMRLGPEVSPSTQAEIDALRQSGAIPALQERVARSTVKALPDQAARIATKDAELAALKQGASQAFQARKAELLKPSFGRDIGSLAKSYAEPLVAAYATDKLGDAAGLDPRTRAGLDAAAGLIFSRTRAGKAVAMRFNRPGNQQAMWGGVNSVAPAAGQFLKRAIQAAALGPTQELAQAQ